jgi:diadenosine tetraphosphate (Ap4A) HIT family hydrolase
MMSSDCFYCAKDQRLKDLMIEICQLGVSTLYLFKEQTYRGRCVVAYKGHINELFELEEKELALFMQDVTRAASAIKKAFAPDKINYGAYSDKLPHLHFHVVPKYKDGYTWGGTFEMSPAQKLQLSDAEYLEIVGLIKKNL